MNCVSHKVAYWEKLYYKLLTITKGAVESVQVKV